MPPVKGAVVVKLSPTGEAVVWSCSFLKTFFSFTAGLDLGRGCVGIYETCHRCQRWELYPEEALQGEQEALEMVPVGYVEVTPNSLE